MESAEVSERIRVTLIIKRPGKLKRRGGRWRLWLAPRRGCPWRIVHLGGDPSSEVDQKLAALPVPVAISNRTREMPSAKRSSVLQMAIS